MSRVRSIDIARGVVMVIMALDHVRDLLHVDSSANPTDLATTTPILFFTRWITHLCAPTFVFLAGVSVYLAYNARPSLREQRQFLLTRGLWLIFLEFTVVNFAIFFDAGFHTLLFEVIAAIGVGFLVLALVLPWNNNLILLAGIVIIAAHNVFFVLPQNGLIVNMLRPFFATTVFPFATDRVLIIAYAPIPWIGIILLGFGSGRLFLMPQNLRSRKLVQYGVVALLLFVLLRIVNVYGDPVPWSRQENLLYSLMSFINLTKYPPSLMFCLLTLGVMCLILALAEKTVNRMSSILIVYGRVPLFYFILHFYLIHCILIVVLIWQGFSWDELQFSNGAFGRPSGVVSGVSLAGVYVIWLAVVIALYLPCRWYGWYKFSRQNVLLKYI